MATTSAEGNIKDPAQLKADMASNEQKKDVTTEAGDAPVANGTNGSSSSNGKETEPVAGPSTSVSPTKKDVEVVNQAMQYLAAGKRDLLIQDPASAVASLAQSCEILGEHYGETAPECGEPYYYYGRALLDLARMEAGVIDNVLDGVPSDDDDKSAENSRVEDPEKCTDEEKEKVAEEVSVALEENFESLEKLKKEKEAKEAAENDSKEKVGSSKDAEAKVTTNCHINGDASTVKVNGEVDDSTCKVNGDADASTKSAGKTNGDHSSVKTNGHAKMNGDKKESEESNSADEEDNEEGNEEKEASEEGNEEANEEANEEDKEEKDESLTGDDKETTEQKDTGDAAAVEKEDEEDPSNLQLAWEMLELAKNILIKQSETLDAEKDKERKFSVESRVSDTFQTLGELSIENENYAQAIDDLNTCLDWRKKLMPEDSRLIAETHYQLGVAQGFNIEFDLAVESLNSAIGVLQKRIDNLKNKTESVDPSKKNDAFYTREGEIKEIEALIPEIREKIADTNDMKEETKKKLGDKRLLEEEIAAKNGEGSKVSSISSNLIKKRKKSGEEESSASDAKKPHVEEQPSTSNGTKNGQ